MIATTRSRDDPVNGYPPTPYEQANLQFIYTPLADQDLLVPGLCGYQAGPFYDLGLGLPSGCLGFPTGSNTCWGEYFYFGDQ